MKKLFLATATAGSLFLTNTTAYAVCSKAVGTFVGGAAGDTYSNGALYNHSVILDTFIINKDGSGRYNFISKTTSGSASTFYKYGATGAWTAANHTFDAVNCRGTINFTGGGTGVYVISETGNTLDYMDYANSNGIMAMIFTLKKSN